MTTNHDAQPDNPALRPPSQPTPKSDSDAAVALIRQKLAAIYSDEPDARQEMKEAIHAQQPGNLQSKHQLFMLQLHKSGKTTAQIQTEWHQYYQSLDDEGKHQVWKEFYSQSTQARQEPSRLQPQYHQQPAQHSQPLPQPEPQPALTQTTYSALHDLPAAVVDDRPPEAIKQQLRQKVSRRGKLQARHHLQSLLFGLGFGALTILVVLFSFFNEVVIAPFIQPSRKVSATPIIVSPDGITPSDKNEVIIPKINVQIPLEFSAKTTDEKEFESALDKGVTHYPTTALPGQKGNASFFGHSSNNIFNPGQYKFAFVLLNELVPGDTFYITYNGVAYAYQVYDKKVVAANAIEILNPVPDKSATAMLVTCDPPGTSLHRLVVWADQVSPNPNDNVAATAPAASASSNQVSAALPGNGPTLWGRIVNFFSGGSD